jgi:uncharacterized repeat protein (TIGR03806 family)
MAVSLVHCEPRTAGIAHARRQRMTRLEAGRSAALAAALVFGVAIVAACSTRGDAAEEISRPAPAIVDQRREAAGVAPPPERAEFGLDARPPNPSCLAPPRPSAAGAAKLERVFADVALEHIMMIAQPPGNAALWFVANRNGTIWSFPAVNPPTQPTVVANLPSLAQTSLATGLSGGLLGFAFHPSFASNGRLYVTFTANRDQGFASEVGYLTTTNGGASFTSYTKIFEFWRSELEYNGGGIAFGHDGALYVSFGAEGAAAQDPTSYHGKILRLDVDRPSNGRRYGIPTSNPFRNGGGHPEIFAMGFRNPFRFSFDRETGELWVGDVGHARYEEIDRVEAGKNYGWPCREGAHDHHTSACASTNGLVDPVYEYAHPAGSGASVTGGVVYRGGAMPSFQGKYIYADFMSLQVRAVSFGSGTPSTAVLNESGPSRGFTHFAEDADGEIYVSTISDHEIYKIVPAGPSSNTDFPDRLSKTGCVDPADPKKPASGLIPYDVNAELWSDGAEKQRWLALPDGQTMSVDADGRLDHPKGSVVVKSFEIGGKLIETRLLVRHEDGDWGGYTYEWSDAQTDAVLLPSRKPKPLATQTWTFPSRNDCARCHGASGRTIGLELAQLNGDAVYPSTSDPSSRIANQLKTLEHIGMFSAPLGKPVSEIPAYPSPFGNAPIDARARAYLHANCGMCHRPGGNAGRAGMDFRFATPLEKANACGANPSVDDLGIPGAKILDPGKPATSIVSLRAQATNGNRMPPLGTSLVDTAGVKLLDDWIAGLQCP